MAKVQKVQILLTVLVEANTPAEADNEIGQMSLGQIAEAIDDGPMIGIMKAGADTVPVERENLQSELEEMGNDGGFFDHLFEDDEQDADDQA